MLSLLPITLFVFAQNSLVVDINPVQPRQNLQWSGNLPADMVEENCDCELRSWAHRHHNGDSPIGVDLPIPSSRFTLDRLQRPRHGLRNSGGANGGSQNSSSGGSGLNQSGTSSSNSNVDAAKAWGSNSMSLDLAELSNSLNPQLNGMVNLGGNVAVSNEYKETAPSGSLLRINLPLFRDNPIPAVARQMRQANRNGWNVILTVMGTPADLATNFDGDDLGRSIPPFARSVPTSADAWAAEVVFAIQDLESRTGLLPKYIEIGNEPDREEYWDGTLADYLALYSATSVQLKSEFPSVLIGGMGLAGSESNMSSNDSALIALQDFATNHSLPLDFLSWHNYGMASSMRYSKIIERLRAKASESNHTLDLIVSEWNIEPNALAGTGEFDSSLGAANIVTFQATASELGLDGACFFMLYDIDDQSGIQDLAGQSIGAMTKRGIKKPSWRVMEILNAASSQACIPLTLGANELALGGIATLDGNNLRLIISNETVEADWIFANGCREAGILPGEAASKMAAAGLASSPDLTATELLGAGFNNAEVMSLLAIFAEVQTALDLKVSGRDLEIDFVNSNSLSVVAVQRFDSTHNDPINSRNDLLPHLELIENDAVDKAIQAGDDFLVAKGYTPVNAVPDLSLSLSDLATQYGLDEETARVWRNTGNRTLRNERLNGIQLFDNLPGAALDSLETASEANVDLQGDKLSFHLEADAVIVIDMSL